MQRCRALAALTFVLAGCFGCTLETDPPGAAGAAGGGPGPSCVAPSCSGCGSCFAECVCETAEPELCAEACASAGSGGTGGGGASSGGASSGGASSGGGGPGSGGLGSGGGSSGGASSGGQSSGGTTAGGGSGGSGGGAGGFAPGAVSWLDFPEQTSASDPSWSSYMTDVIRHLPSSYGNQYWDADKVTYVHETTHGINSHLRNYFNNTGKKANGFYVGSNEGVIVVEPAIMKSDANSYVPVSLRESRYDLYLLGATDWDDTPLYLFDEWIAYTNGTEAGVNLANEGKWTDGWRDLFGSLEFTVYALALGMAVEAKDPSYFSGYPQFRELMKWNTERAMKLYFQARVMPDFAWDQMDAYYQKLQQSPDAADLRSFVKTTYGDAWAQSVMGI